MDFSLLLNNSIDFDENKLKLLETLVETFYKTNNNNDRTIANKYLNDYKQLENSWQHADKILQNSSHTLTKTFAVSILEDLVKTKFNLLSTDQKLVIRNFIIEILIKTVSDTSTQNEQTMVFIKKLNMTIVAIAKSEWATTWGTFMSEICSSGKSSQELCENNLNILLMLK